MIVSRRFAEEQTIAFRDQPTVVGHRPSTELRRQAMPTHARVVYEEPLRPAPPRASATVPSKFRGASGGGAAARGGAPPRFLALVLVCLVSMLFGVGLGFVVREGQARAASHPTTTTTSSNNSNHAIAHVSDSSIRARTFVSLGAESKAVAPAPVLRRAASPRKSLATPSASASTDEFEPTFRVTL